MLDIFVADDDKIIRRGLKALIESSSTHMRVVGEASNGRQALESIQNLKPDVLISDVKMPMMDGRDLVRRIHESGIKLKSIILSGYDDFEFVRDTLKYGAVDYILKPLENESFLNLLGQIASRIEVEREEERQRHMQKEDAEEAMAVKKERFLLRLLDEQDPHEFIGAAGLDALWIHETDCFLLAAMDFSPHGDVIDRKTLRPSLVVRNQWRQVLTRLCRQAEPGLESLAADLPDGRMLLFLAWNVEGDRLESEASRILERFRAIVSSERIWTVAIGIGKSANDVSMIYPAFHQACLALQNRFYEGSDRVFRHDACGSGLLPCKSYEHAMHEEMESLLEAMTLGRTPQVRHSIQAILEKSRSARPAPDIFRGTIYSLFMRAFLLSDDFRAIEEEFTSGETDIYRDIRQAASIDDLERCATGTLERMMCRVMVLRGQRCGGVVFGIKDYVQKHYQENITLKTVSSRTFMNYTYLSELFKSETKGNFSDYLAAVRIEAAKKLLEQSRMKIADIGQAVGYDEAVSFSRAFKKCVGICPAQYRDHFGSTAVLLENHPNSS